jgi:C-1 hydroxylase
VREENERRLRDWIAAGDAGRLEEFDHYLHPEVVVHAPLGLSTRSADHERQVWRAALDAFPDLHHDVRETLSRDSTVAARIVVTGTHLGGAFAGIEPRGGRFTVDQAIFAHLQDGLIVELWELVDGASVRQQLSAGSQD